MAARGRGPLSKAVLAAGGVTGAFLVLALGVLLSVPLISGAGASPVMGSAVPAERVPALLAAHANCPELSPSLLAAEVAEAGGLGPPGPEGYGGLSDEEWSRWGAPGASRVDPDAHIAALGALTCHLLERSVALGASDPARAALIARFDSLAAIEADSSGSTVARSRAARILALAASAEYAVSVPSGSGDIEAALPVGYRNGRSAEQAVAWALSQVGVARDAGWCARFVRTAYRFPRPHGHAYLYWTNPRVPAALRHPGDENPPRGAVLLWGPSIGGGSGHIAISLGGGLMVTTTDSAVSIRRIDSWSRSAYYGWINPYSP